MAGFKTLEQLSREAAVPLRLDSRWDVGDRGAVYEFNVKLGMALRGVAISDDMLHVETEMAVRIFGDQLRKRYPWIGKVELVGRSGGWLAIEDKKGGVNEAELKMLARDVEEARTAFEQSIIESFGYAKGAKKKQRKNGTPSRIDPKLKKAYDFFREHAGGVVGRSAENSLGYAKAEALAEKLEWEFVWEEDPEPYETDASGDEPFEVLTCTLKDADGEWLASVGSVGMTGRASQDRIMRRLIEAELALEAADKKGLL